MVNHIKRDYYQDISTYVFSVATRPIEIKFHMEHQL